MQHWLVSCLELRLFPHHKLIHNYPDLEVVQQSLYSLSQLVYQVLFSYTFFFEGYTGLAITILCVVTLFATMQFTGRLDWERIFRQDGRGGSESVNRVA